MRKETCIYLSIVDGTQVRRFFKCIKGELVVPTEKTSVVAVDGWADLEVRDHYVDLSDKNVIVSGINLEKISVEQLGGNMDRIRKELRKAGFREW